jgi:hypothetical protein
MTVQSGVSTAGGREFRYESERGEERRNTRSECGVLRLEFRGLEFGDLAQDQVRDDDPVFNSLGIRLPLSGGTAG